MTSLQVKKEKLKKRLDKALKKLPNGWVLTFIIIYPAYKKMKTHLYNVARGKSLDEEVIEKMEELVLTIKQKQ